MITLKPLALSLTLLGALAASPAFAEVPQKAPEIATAYAEKSGWAAQKFMVAAANPLAADAGYQMLKQGGSAIDAAIATQLVLTLVEPQSSGIGGGAFLLYSDRQGRAGLRRARNGACRRRRTPVPECRRQPRLARHGRGGRAFRGRAGRAAHAGTGAQGAWQAAVGDPVRPRHQAGARRLSRQPAPPRPVELGPGPEARPCRRRVFL